METNIDERVSTLKVASDLTSMPIVLAWFDQFLHAPLSEALWIQGQTALVEGFSNAVRHAHANLDPTPDVETKFLLSNQRICIEIRDQGPRFDLEAALLEMSQIVQQETFNPLEREEHWGLFLLMKLRDDHGWQIRYVRNMDDHNCLQISHHLAGANSVGN